MSHLKQQLQDSMKEAMRSKDAQRLSVIRLLISAIKQREIDERIELDDAQVLAILDKQLKQRKDSIQQFHSANREDLVIKETFEMDVIQEFMPKPLLEEEISSMIDHVIKSTDAASIKDMGKVMAALKPEIQGRADIATVSAQIKSKLSEIN